jgi:hypothetical protein
MLHGCSAEPFARFLSWDFSGSSKLSEGNVSLNNNSDKILAVENNCRMGIIEMVFNVKPVSVLRAFERIQC